MFCKWQPWQVRKFFFVSLVFHFIFTMLHTAYVLLVFSWQCKLKVRQSRSQLYNFVLTALGPFSILYLKSETVKLARQQFWWDDYRINDICCDELNNSTNCLMDWTKPIVKDHCRYNESVTDFSLMQVITHNVELDFDFRWKILIWSAFDDKKIWFDNLDCIAG